MSNSHQPFNLQGILERLGNADSDYRFMTLNDLHSYLTNANNTGVTVDSFQNVRLLDGVLKALDDVNGEVQNLAVKCIGPLVTRQKDSGVEHILRNLTKLCKTTSPDPSIRFTALRNAIAALPRPNSAAPPVQIIQAAPSVQGAQLAVSNLLIPELYNMLDPETEGQPVTPDTVELLIETLRCFGKILSPKDVEKLQVHVMGLLEHNRTSAAVRKRAVTAVSILCIYAPDVLLSSFISHLIESLTQVHLLPTKQRLLISVTAALASSIPQRFAPYLGQVCPLILSVVKGGEEQEDEDNERSSEEDDLKEAALVALDAFQSNCTQEMRKFTEETIHAGLEYLKYDPNFAGAGSDDEEMGGTEEDDDEFADDDDFEQENFSDEDDLSWKIRRCSAKLIATIINTRCKDLLDDGTLYNKIAPTLVDRFNEREESVRLEILSTTTLLIRRTGELAVTAFVSNEPPVATKKRRRTSDAATEAPPPAPVRRQDSFPEQSLTKLVPKLTKAVSKLLRDPKTTVATKGGSVALLSAVVTALRGGLGDYLGQFVGYLTEMAGGGANLGSQSGASGAASGIAANSGNVRIEVIRLLGKICKEHELRVLRPHIGAIVSALVSATQDRYYKVSSEAINVTNDVVKLLTETTSSHTPEDSKLVQSIFDVILEKVKANDVDLEVRRRSVSAIGVILSRTTVEGQGVNLSSTQRKEGLDALLQRLKNETTIIMAIKAIDKVVSSPVSSNILEADWVTTVVNVLGLQLRKSNRSLRAAALETLKAFSENDTAKSFFDTEARADLLHVIVQMLPSLDPHLLSPALLVAKSILEAGDIGVDNNLVAAICQLVQNPLGGGLVETSLVSLVKVIGELPGDGGLKGKQALMNSLLQDIGVTGETQSVAKVIAQLLVSGGPVYQVGVEDFVAEASRNVDNKRKCLALMVLGECGLRMGKSFGVQPDVFLKEFKSADDDVPIAAAVALGLAAVGSLDTYLPVIMQRLGGNDKDQYLLLHSLKEIIQHSAEKPENIKPVATDIWKALFAVAKDDDSKAVGAECLGRLTVINPQLFLEDLHQHLSSADTSTRGMVISAFRFTFSDTPSSYDDLLRPIVVKALTVMLSDAELDNRKLALTALNSAAHNKPHLVLPHLGNLLPLVYRESKIRPELVREVQMGPFKHKVDDGLEVRKSAYETLYALLDTSLPGVPIQPLFERVIVGLEDEHDIRVLCNLMIPRLIAIARADVINRLSNIVERFRSTLNLKLKDNAVKQELEKNAELVRSTLRTSKVIQKDLGKDQALSKTAWPQYWEWVKTTFTQDIKQLEGEETTAF
ncbi:TIP120-domain-containing protein [Ascobolus immersus RN42]|uniref:TIP120-domain-containing protein n=1 Tax=Ascobolus immersus RN42 TaxID=1160509 RepID=A0A3N4HUL8_ASCIM|nr:TIP120-domain-containing protein [Ascobolus immersus RN42]